MSPLIGRGASGRGLRSGLRGSRLAATALMASALLVCASSMPSADELQQDEAEQTVRNAHQKPDPIPYRQVLEQFIAREDKILCFDLIAAPDFESEAILLSRLKHSRDIVRDTGPGLGIGLRIDRTRRAGNQTFLLFASGKHLSGSPAQA